MFLVQLEQLLEDQPNMGRCKCFAGSFFLEVKEVLLGGSTDLIQLMRVVPLVVGIVRNKKLLEVVKKFSIYQMSPPTF